MKHLLWIVPLLIVGYVAWYLLATTVETLPMLTHRKVTRVYDRDYEYYVFLPAATVERLLRSPDEFTLRRRTVLGI